MQAAASRIALLLALVAPEVAAACPKSSWEKAELELVRPSLEPGSLGVARPRGSWDHRRIEVRARSLVGDLGPLSEARGLVRDGCTTLSWPAWPEYYLRPNTPFMTTICAEGESGERSCFRDVLILMPRARQRPRDESSRLHIFVRRVAPGEVVETAPDEPMPRAAPVHRGVPWRYALGAGTALLLAVAIALLRARLRRSIRAT